MIPANDNDNDNIYKICRMRANQASKTRRFSSREKTEGEFSQAGRALSAASLKAYEVGKTVPNPDTVVDMADVYGTPELKWLHCSKACPIGRDIAPSDDEIGTDDIYHTYFELVGSFDKVNQIEQQLHTIISDRKLNKSELPIMRDILNVMDRITENAKDLRVWIEKEGIDLNENA